MFTIQIRITMVATSQELQFPQCSTISIAMFRIGNIRLKNTTSKVLVIQQVITFFIKLKEIYWIVKYCFYIYLMTAKNVLLNL